MVLHPRLSDASWPGVSSLCLPIAAASPHRREGHDSREECNRNRLPTQRPGSRHTEEEEEEEDTRLSQKPHDFPRSRGNSSHSEPAPGDWDSTMRGAGTLSFLLSTALLPLQEHQCQGTGLAPAFSWGRAGSPAQPWAWKPAL